MSEAFIVDYVRTPIGRFGGVLSSVRADDLAAAPLKALLARHPGLDPAAIEEVFYGCANQAGEDNRNVARMAALLAGLPVTTPGVTINRLCGSGLDAVAIAARQIKTGEADLVIAGGVESMSRAPFVLPKADAAFSRNAEIYDTTIGWRFVNPLMKERHGVDSMPETAENVAEQFQIARADQDAFALRSQQRAVAAQKNGRLAKEIAPVVIPRRKGDPVVVDADEHPRADTTLEALAKLPTPFRKGGTVTAGNASGVNDGAAALLIASRGRGAPTWPDADRAHRRRRDGGRRAAHHGFRPRAFDAQAVRTAGAQGVSDFDVIELNEAFAAQALAVLRDLGLADDAPHVNPNGGAIALGHPLGASGARLAGSAALELFLNKGRRALATMCIGVGQGFRSRWNRFERQAAKREVDCKE